MRSNHQIIAYHYAASARHDLEGMLADLAADVQWTGMAGSSLDIPDCVKKAVREAADQLYREEKLDVNDPESIFTENGPNDRPTEVVRV